MALEYVFSQISFIKKNEFWQEFENQSNTLSYEEFVLLAYNKWGLKFLSKIEGDFSFVLYDKRKNMYIATRDQLGLRPLYYIKIDSNYYFSADINDLFRFSNNNLKKPNLKSMRTMLFQRTVDYTDTMYEGIYRLPPGHFMVIKDGKEHIERYWYPEKIKIDHNITEAEAAKKLTDLFSKAIEKRATNLEETAFEVSGGLDSSSVVSLLSQNIAPSNIDSYSMEFKSLECDEGEYVDSILEKYSLFHKNISVGKLDYEKKYSLEDIYTMSPNWPITLTFAMSLPMLEKMKADGKKIVITGQGGDHLFTGTPYVLYDLFRRFKFLTLYRELKFFSKRWNIIKAYIVKPILGKNSVNLIEKLLGKKGINPFFEEDTDIKDLSQIVNIPNPAFKNDLDVITSAAYSTIMDGSIFHCAEEHFGIEYRHPYFDLELVEFVLSLPPEMKYKQRTIKWILRKAMDGVLPDKIRDRKDKAEFSEVIMQQIHAINLGTLLDDPYIVKLGLIEQSIIDKYRQEYEDKTIKYIVILWTIINMEYWYRYNFEKESLSH